MVVFSVSTLSACLLSFLWQTIQKSLEGCYRNCIHWRDAGLRFIHTVALSVRKLLHLISFYKQVKPPEACINFNLHVNKKGCVRPASCLIGCLCLQNVYSTKIWHLSRLILG